MQPKPTTVTPPAKASHVRWFLIGWIFVISAVAYLDRVNVSIAGSSMMSDFHLTNEQFGYVFSAFVLGYALTQAPAGRLADYLGARRVLALAVVWWAVFTVLTASIRAAASVLALLLAVRFALGIGEAVMYPASNCIVARWIPTAERGLANGIIFAGVGAGAGVTPPLIVAIMVRYGWRSAFWVSAALGLIVGAVWLAIARDKPEEHPWTNASEREFISTGLPPVRPSRSIAWKTILSSREVLAVTASYSTYGYVAYIFFSWFFIYIQKVRGLNLKASAAYSTLPFLAMAVCSPLGGVLADRLTRRYGRRAGRCGTAVVGLALAAVFVALGSGVTDARLASVVLAGGAGALYLSQSSFWAVTADIAGDAAGVVSGFMNMGGQIGGAVTASVTPAIATRFGWTASFLAAAGLSALGAVAWLFVRPEKVLASEP